MEMLPLPKTQTQEVLYVLLNSAGRISYHDLYTQCRVINHGQRLSDLRKLGLELPCLEMECVNKFGRKTTYGTWSINGQLDLALEIYKKLTTKK